jgi:hypothetical protein
MASTAEILEFRQRGGAKNSGSWPADPLQIGKGHCREVHFATRHPSVPIDRNIAK